MLRPAGPEVLSLLLLAEPAACAGVRTRPRAVALRLNRSLPSCLLLISTPPPSSPLNLPPHSGHAHAGRKFLAGKNQLFNPLLPEAQQPGARSPQTSHLAPPPRSRSLPRSISPGPAALAPAAERPPGGLGVPRAAPQRTGRSPGAAARPRCLHRSGPGAPHRSVLHRTASNRAEQRRTALLPAAAPRPLPAEQSRGTGLTGTCPEGRRETKAERMKKWGEDGGRDLLPLNGFRDRKLFCLSEKILREDPGSRLPVRGPPPG